MAILDVRQLCLSYRVHNEAFDVLRSVSFTIEEGEYVAIQGPSGSGKSSLFYVLGGMLAPTSGSVIVNGRDITTLDDLAMAQFRNRELGFVFQQFHLLPKASLLENVLLPTTCLNKRSKIQRDQFDQAVALMERLGLANFRDRHSNQLSGGQQQRTAIARALMLNPSLILADEPTGNLDSHNARQILDIFDELNAQGRTIVMITHDPEIARRCRRVLTIRDGRIVSDDGQGRPKQVVTGESPSKLPAQAKSPGIVEAIEVALRSLPDAFRNIARERTKSLLTMLGIVIGIAAVLAMISLGTFARNKIMEGFESLGANKLVVRGYTDWNRKATDEVSAQFTAFDPAKDLAPLRRLFPAIKYYSPVLATSQVTVTAGGKQVDGQVSMRGVNHEYLTISNGILAQGRDFNPYQIENRNSVCIVGHAIADRLLPKQQQLDELIYISANREQTFPCKVIGILKSQKSSNEWFQPDLQVLVPYTFYQTTARGWQSQIHEVALTIRSAGEVEATGAGVKKFFQNKYGKSGRFNVDAEATIIAQTKRFLGIFATLLTGIAFLSLLVGGIGIHNMMLVSVVERVKEIGLRKALGASSHVIKVQVLVETTLLCITGGAVGVICGFLATELMILAAGKFVKDLPFEWVIDPLAIAVSVLSTLAVGLLSGMEPARRAEKFAVIDALRSE